MLVLEIFHLLRITYSTKDVELWTSPHGGVIGSLQVVTCVQSPFLTGEFECVVENYSVKMCSLVSSVISLTYGLFFPVSRLS